MRKIRGPIFLCVLFIAAAAATALIGLAPETENNDGQQIHVDSLRRPFTQSNMGGYQGPTEGILAGRNVNMVSGTRLPDGDPWLQRQNEPSIAVSTRNPLHLLAGANDYRTVDFPFTEGELPGLMNSAGGDAWLGIFKSFDGGATWKTSLLPGFPQDRSPEGMASPLKKFSTAADPIVRAGTNGLFYYSGMAFNRAQQRGGGSLFVARFIDNNDVEGGDSIKYLDTRIIEEGDPGNFIDMPRIAVDVPRGMGTVTIDGQPIPRSNIYAAYTVFVGDSNVAIRSQIWFRRSTDCGQTWGPAIKISDAQHIVQGTAIAIDPNSGAVYVAYRRFQHPSQPSAVVIVKSTDFGATFSRPAVIANVHPFDQPTTEDWIAPPFGTSFRTNSYPTMTVDDKGVVYVAWAERGRGAAQATRIVLYTSQSGSSWNGPRDVDNNSLELGHQFMPFLTFAAGKLTMVWYDQRDSACIHWSGVDDWVSDGGDYRQTIDVRAAQADPGLFPSFEPSVQVSRYLWALFEESSGKQYVQQVQFNPPNYPLFRGGTAPFIGDYIEVTPAPMFVRDEAGAWRFNTAPSSAPVFHAVWTDNRDVRPPGPENNYDWTNYTPPASDQGDFGYQDCLSVNIPGMGMRNQNIYTSALTRGVIAAAPANSKPLGTGLGYYPGTGELVQRSFVIYAKNPTEVMKSFRLSIVSPPADGTASFLEFESLSSLDVVITAFSTIARTVFVRSEDITDTVTIRVVEIDWSGYEVEGGLTGEIVLNPDPTNPQFDPTTDEIHNPNIRNTQIINWTEVLSPNIRNPNIVNPNVINALIINPNVVNPNIVNPNIRNPNIRNPNIVNPNIRNPNIRNANIINPNIVNPNIRNDSLEDAEIYDVTATVVNDGNTTTSYTLKTYAKESIPEDVYLQLLVYKTYYTPAAATEEESGPDACLLKVEAHHELVVNIANPNIRNPNIANPNIRNPNIRNESVENTTFALAPGEEAEVMVRIIRPIENDNNNDAQVYSRSMRLQSDVGIRQAFDLETFVESIGFAATSQSVNTYEAREEGVTQPPASASKLIIGTSTLPDGVVGTWYSTTLEAYGGVEPYHWSLNSGTLPPGLGLGSDGTIIGTPATEGFYRFVARVDDSDGDFDTQSFSIYIAADDVTPTPLTIVTTSLPSGVLDYWYGATLDAIGGTWPRTWSLESGYLPPGLELDSDGVISGTIRREADRDYPVTYNFTVRVTDKDGLWDRSALSIVVNERTGVTYTISGYVYGEGGAPLDGVVMRGLPNTPVTGATGYYEDTLPQGWSGTVTPNKAGYSFAPESRSYADLASDMPNQNYNIAVPTYTISGRVTMEGSGLSGVVMSGLPVYAVTDADGYYSASVSTGWSGTVTPTLAGYMFNPPSRDYADVASDQTGQDYAASLVTAAITVTSPNGGETWATGSTQDVTWTQTGLTGTVTIDLYKGGAYTKTLGMAEAPAGTFSWAIDPDETPGTDYRVVIWQGETTDQSDGDFTIVASAIDMAEREALIALYNATNGDNWADNSGWKEPPLYSDGFAMPGTETQWYGVGIYGRHVRQIAMGGNNMSGAIPAQIGGFAYLERLHLQDNQLSGNIPAALGGLTSLRELGLSGNQLSGNIPESLGNLAEIWYLWLGDNRLSGEIPDSLGNLYNLYHLYLNNNELSGSIPASLGNLAANLQDLRLHSNHLRGNIPSSLANLTNLSYLSIDYNALYTSDAGLIAFLGEKSPDWYMTQTVAPTDVLATGTGPDTILVSWTPIPYTGDGGGYRVYWRIAAEDPYTFYGQTADKTASSLSVSGLATGQTHYFVVQTRTDPHLYNQNIVDSEYSLEVIAAPLGQVQISGTVTLGDSALAGVLMSGLPGEPVTDANGYYSTSVSYGWSGTVTPTLEGYVFDPPSRAYSNLAEDQLGDDYTANLFQAVIAVTSPNGGEVWTAGSTYDITWTQMGLTGTVTIDLTKGGAYTKTLGTAEAAAGTFSWAIDPGETPGTDYRVTVWQGEIADQSDGEFTIAAAPLEPGERQALIALYHATGGDNWTNNSGWKQPPLHTDGFALPGTEGTWHGITAENNHITRLEIWQNNLDGTIPAELGNLTNLQVIALAGNQLTGTIPSELGSLTSLQALSLPSNQLSGNIPIELRNLTNLRTLYLSNNQLTGEIPAELGNLSSLLHFLLHSNQLTGEIPAELGNLTSLQSLYLYRNQLTGEIPAELGYLSDLQWLDLSVNQLTGGIPPELGNLNNLVTLNLSSNQLMGGIPPELGGLASLRNLHLSSNPLWGSIPTELGDLDSLEVLNLASCQLGGRIPAELANLSSLRILFLNLNNLSENIPPELGSLSSLQTLDLSHNNLTGSIPSELSSLSQLRSLNLGANPLTPGPIPEWIADMPSLQSISLYQIGLTESIPAWLGSMTNLNSIGLGWNQLTGSIPPELANLSNLRGLYLGPNQLTGTIPAELGSLTTLQYLWLNRNQLSGTIPPELGNLSSLHQLFLGSNQLTGNIPAGLANLTNLSELSLDYNALYAQDAELLAFLNEKNPDWWMTQTVAPNDVSATGGPGSVVVSWTPIPYTDDGGGYLVSYSEVSAGPYTFYDQTADKSASSLSVSGLVPGQPYYFVVQTRTDPHVNNQNTVDSEYSMEIMAVAGSQVLISGTITIDDSGLAGVVMSGLPGEPVTDYSGIYSGVVSPGWSGTVTPMLTGYVFEPSSRTYSNISEDQLGNDYTATFVQAVIVVTSPNGGEIWTAGSTYDITWAQTAVGGTVTIDLTKGGAYAKTLGTAEAAAGTFPWTIDPDETPGTDYRVAIWQGDIADQSDGDFTIAAAPLEPVERQALIALYNATNGDNWMNNSGWKEPPLHTDGFAMPGTEGTWRGISVGGSHVIQINLAQNNLNGIIPSDLGNLPNLQRLYLQLNQLTGGIPTELGNLPNLQWLYLNSNQLTGTIPATLGNLTALQGLNLGYNQLSGSIPPELGSLTNLEWLYLQLNQLTGGIPTELGNLANLQGLYLNTNPLGGTIPAELGNLTNLRTLYLTSNQLSGNIPKELGELTNLQTLYLSANQLSGAIPAELGNLHNLRTIYFVGNQLTGTIPVELGNLSNLESLYLSGNQLTGTIPVELGYLSNLQRLDLGSNQLTGSIPLWLGDLTNMILLNLTNNQLTGGIPTELGNLTNLLWLYLDANQLSGSIPAELGNLTNLRGLGFRGNQLTGSIPMELGALTELRTLYLFSNRLSGSIPTDLANLINLTTLNIGYNALYTDDGSLVAFLDDKSPGWADTQTIAPANVEATPVDPTTVNVTWDAIPYTGDSGGYRVFTGESSGGPYTFFDQTSDKSAMSMMVTGLNASVPTYFVVQTWTDPHGNNQNTVDSEYSEEVMAAPLGQVLISGTVTLGDLGLAGVVMSGLPGEPVTDANGYYSTSVSYGWSGTVTPMLEGYSFDPANRIYVNVASDQTGQDYAAAPLGQVLISGTVTDDDTPLAGVVMSGLPGDPSTNESGYYSASVSYGWSGTVTPTLAGYAFDPPSTTYTNVTADQLGQDYVASPVAAPLFITSTPLPEGVKNEPYETWFEAAGGVPPLQWSIASGALPSGMVLNADNGRLAGTPTESGVFSFTVRVSDAIEQQDTRELILIIADWVARYDGPGHGFDNPRAIAVDPSGHVYVTGRSRGSGTYADYATIKYSGSGAVQWIVRTGDETGNSEASAVAVDALGNVYVTGSSMGEGTDSDYTTVKYDSSGTVQWIARYDGPASSSDEARAIAVDASGNVYVTGMSYGFMTSADYATVKYDASGAEQWVARYDGPGNIWDEAWAIAVDAAGNVYVTGQSAGSGTGFDYATIKYDRSGAELWVARYNGPGNGLDSGRAIAVDAAGNVYVTGSSYDSGTGPDYATIKYDPSGAELWVARYTGPGNAEDEARAIAVDTEGNVYVTGKSAGSGTDDDYATIKYSPSGEQQWVARYNGPGNNTDWGQAISVDPMGHVYVAGASQGSGTTFDFATIRYDGWGAEQWVARYDGGISGVDYVLALAIDQLGNIFVTGPSEGSGTDYDYVTIRYTQSFPSTIIITTEALDIAYEGVPYSKALWAFGGSGARAWSITAGSLPPGMELVPGTGIIEGTPTEAGVFNFAVRVQDGLLSAVKDLSLTVYEEGYEFLLAWGSQGAEDGQFDNPWGVAVQGSTDVYVTDTNNNRIQKFTSDGSFITKWGSMGDGDGEFRSPHGIAVDGSGDVYVVDTFGYRIQKFDSDGDIVTKWGSRGEGEGQFGLPRGIAVDSSGHAYVLDSGHYVLKFTSVGTFVTKWGNEGSGDGQFSYAYGIAVDGSGNVYVADTYNNRIQKFTSDGVFVTKWGSFGNGDGQFNNPFGIAVDGSGDVYVTDTNNNRIQIFTSDGSFITEWGSAGEGDGQFNTPWGIAVDGSGDVYVLDAGNRVQKFRKK